MKLKPLPAQTESRAIRVFVSSTFSDMKAERDYLVKFTFPQLRKLCEQRSVVWGEVDLRWGIPDEEKAEGKVLPICLAEIQRCRPYFIGLLGERYGTIPEKIPTDLIEREPWLKEHMDHSITELEILHGVLNDSAMADHAFFYFRDPAYLENIPVELRTDFLPESAEAVSKLRTLKDRIRRSGLPVRENYHDHKQLGEWVLEDFTRLIDELFPENQVPNPLDREAMEHEVFARSRAVVEVRPGQTSGVYIGRPAYFERLDQHAAGDGPPLVILGESGSGKSALLANWALRYRNQHPDAFLILHFIGASPNSAYWATMVRRILNEIFRRFQMKIDLKIENDQEPILRDAFTENSIYFENSFLTNYFYHGAITRNVILVLDALDQLEDRDGALDLAWLPVAIHPKLRLIVSTTLPSRPLDELGKRVWSTLTVEALNVVEREQLIQDYLSQYAKKLNSQQIKRIAEAPQTGIPLYLRALLKELRVFGQHEQLDARIADYLASKTLQELFEKILKRFESDFEPDRPGLVKEVMSLIWAARRGLSEKELLDLLGAPDEPLPQAYWSPFYLSTEHVLASHSGLICLFHKSLRQAVLRRYLPSQSEQSIAHLRLVDYFKNQPQSLRQIDELPWQLAEAEAWPVLAERLADLEFFHALWQANKQEVIAYWARIEEHSPLRPKEAYHEVLARPESYPAEWVRDLSELLSALGHLEEALTLDTQLIQKFTAEEDRRSLSIAIGNQALSLMDSGDLDGAWEQLKESERLFLELHDTKNLSVCHGNQALILYKRGDLKGALELFKLQERSGDQITLSRSLGNQSVLQQDLGDLDEAMALMKEQERLSRHLGDREGLSNSLGNQAAILIQRDDLDGAMRLLKEQERLSSLESYNPRVLQSTLGNQAVILRKRGDLDGAMRLLKEQERLCRKFGEPTGLSNSLGNQANILADRGDLDGAMALLKETEQMDRKLGNQAGLKDTLHNQAAILIKRRDPEGLHRSLGNQTRTLIIRGDLDEAMSLSKEQERLCREFDDSAGLKESLENQAAILIKHRDLDGAMVLAKEIELLCRKLDDPVGLYTILYSQTMILTARGDLDGAMALLKEQEQLFRNLGDQAGLKVCLGNQAQILQARGDLDGALALHQEQEQLCRQLDEPAEMQDNLDKQAHTPQARGDLDEALALHQEQEQLCRQLDEPAEMQDNLDKQAHTPQARGDLDDMAGLQSSLGGQANILYTRGDLEGALVLYKEQEELCRKLGNTAWLQSSLGGQAKILYTRGDLDGAFVLYKEQEALCRELDNPAWPQISWLLNSLDGQANILYTRGDLDGALMLYKEQEELCRKLDDLAWLQSSLGGQANILYTRGDLEGALVLYKEQEELCRKLGNTAWLQNSLDGQANILYTRGDLDGALVLYKDQEHLCCNDHNTDGLVRSLINQAQLLAYSKAQPCVALPLAEKAYGIALENNLVALAGQITPTLQKIRQMVNP